MKARFVTTAFFIMSCVFAGAVYAQPVWIDISGGIEQATIQTKIISKEPNVLSQMAPTYSVGINGNFLDSYRFHVVYKNDAFWQNTLRAGLGYNMSFVNADVGVQLGMKDWDEGLNIFNIESWNIGLTAAVEINFPGVFFAGGNMVLNMGGGSWSSGQPGSSRREAYGAQLGFWLPHIYLSGGYETKNYDELITGTDGSRSGEDKYYARAEFFAKRVPFRLRAEFGNISQTATWSTNGVFLASPEAWTYMYAGGRVSLELSRWLTWYVDVRVPVSGLNAAFTDAFTATSGLTFKIVDLVRY